MARVVFTANLARHIAAEPVEADGATVREVLDKVFAGDDVARSYVLDDQSALRKHMNIFVDGNRVRDRVHLSDPVPGDGEVYVIQALSGG
ncbi:MAG: MoaD/ThiS family protein [Hyphomicrobiales bacterium]